MNEKIKKLNEKINKAYDQIILSEGKPISKETLEKLAFEYNNAKENYNEARKEGDTGLSSIYKKSAVSKYKEYNEKLKAYKEQEKSKPEWRRKKEKKEGEKRSSRKDGPIGVSKKQSAFEKG